MHVHKYKGGRGKHKWEIRSLNGYMDARGRWGWASGLVGLE